MKRIQILAKKIIHPILKPVTFKYSDGLTTDEAAILAVLNNPDLRVERDNLLISQAQVLQAGLLPNPTLSTSFDFGVAGETNGTTSPYGIGANINISSLINRKIKKGIALSKAKQVNITVAWKELQTAEAARILVFRIKRLKQQIKLFEKIEKRMRKSFVLTNSALAKGFITKMVQASFQESVNNIRSKILSRISDLDSQFISLKRILGLPSGYKLKIQNSVSLPEHISLPPLKTLEKDLSRRRLDLIAFHYGYESQEARVRLAVRRQFPRISFGFNHSRDNSDFYSIGYGISIDLPIFNHNQARIALQRVTRAQLFDEYIKRIFQARIDIAKLAEFVSSLNLQIMQMKKNIEDISHILSVYQEASRKGHLSILTYYASWNKLTILQIKLIQLKETLAESGVALALSSGFYKIESVEKLKPISTVKIKKKNH